MTNVRMHTVTIPHYKANAFPNSLVPRLYPKIGWGLGTRLFPKCMLLGSTLLITIPHIRQMLSQIASSPGSAQKLGGAWGRGYFPKCMLLGSTLLIIATHQATTDLYYLNSVDTI